jgi:beta-propeller repeat-containing protein
MITKSTHRLLQPTGWLLVCAGLSALMIILSFSGQRGPLSLPGDSKDLVPHHPRLSRGQSWFPTIIRQFPEILVTTPEGEPNSRPTTNSGVKQDFGKLAMSFELNEGQAGPGVKFLSRGNHYNVFLTSTEAVIALSKTSPGNEIGRGRAPYKPGQTKAGTAVQGIDVVRMKLMNANSKAEIVGLNELPGKSNYFFGNNPANWRRGVSHFERVNYRNVYPGVDLVYYGNQRQLEYDFVVAPGASPRSIGLKIVGAQNIEVDPSGNLRLHIPSGEILQERPSIYQNIDGRKRAVGGGYVFTGNNQVGFVVDSYDTSRPLIIDPVLSYSTYLGGGADDAGYAVAIDSAGNAYIVGSTLSTNFPTVNPFGPNNSGLLDIFVTKLSATGATVLYSTYIGGVGDEEAFAIACNSSGEAYLTGYTNSPNFPLIGALQPLYGGGDADAFLVRLGSGGNALISSTYAGGSGIDAGTGIALDNSRNIYGIGVTTSPNLQTVNAIQNFYAGGVDGFLLKLSPAANSVIFSTYAGGSGDDFGNAIAVDASGSVYAIGDTNSIDLTTVNPLQSFNAGGFDAYLAKLTPSGTSIVFATYAGGNGDDFGTALTLDSSGNIYAIGYTNSTNLQLIVNAVQPQKAAGYDAFLGKLSSNGTTIFYSTFFGGNNDDFGHGIAVDTAGNAYVTGATLSTDFPIMNPLQSANAGARDIFVSKLTPNGGSILFSTYLGGTADDVGVTIVADAAANAFVVGGTASTNFKTANPLQPSSGGGLDAIVAKISTLQPTTNPLDDPQFFVRQHYLDFLNREPDAEGRAYWTSKITECGADPQCIRSRRIEVSNAFFFELEFQQTGAYVFRLYRAAYGNTQPFPNPDADPRHPGENMKIPNYAVFVQDRAGLVGGANLAQLQLDVANAFVQRPEFLSRYPGSLSGAQFVDAVLTTIRNDTGADLFSQRDTLIANFNTGGRGRVMFHLANDYWNRCDRLPGSPPAPCVPPNFGPAVDNRPFIDAEYNRSTVVTQYFGYLRRDVDIDGYIFWLGKVNSCPLRNLGIQHAMVCSFITSAEYQERFSPVVTHTNAECPQVAVCSSQ